MPPVCRPWIASARAPADASSESPPATFDANTAVIAAVRPPSPGGGVPLNAGGTTTNTVAAAGSIVLQYVVIPAAITPAAAFGALIPAILPSIADLALAVDPGNTGTGPAVAAAK